MAVPAPAAHGQNQIKESGGQPLVYGSVPELTILQRQSGASTHVLSGVTASAIAAASNLAPSIASGSPEGAVTRSPGAFHLNTDTDNLWIKKTGTGNTGWIQLLSLLFCFNCFGQAPSYQRNSATTNVVPQMATNSAVFSLTTNDFVLNSYYTNSNQRSWVATVVGMTNVLGTDKAQVSLYLDQDGDGTFERTGIHCRLQGVALLAGAEELSAFLQPSARFIFTNFSSGTGVSSIEANSSQWVRQ